jgi:hypothetical protein
MSSRGPTTKAFEIMPTLEAAYQQADLSEGPLDLHALRAEFMRITDDHPSNASQSVAGSNSPTNTVVGSGDHCIGPLGILLFVEPPTSRDYETGRVPHGSDNTFR